MTNDDNINISRRKILGGLGAVGIGAAGAGLGTTAFLSDTESFTDNTLTAGELDLNVDWEEHYYDGSSGAEQVSWSEPGEGEVGFPDPENPHVAIAEEDVSAFMDATAIEAFPDPNDDGIQELSTDDWAYDPCRDGADLDEDLTPTVEESATRTSNGDTVIDGEEAAPLLNLTDVKPGDFGEFTLSFHLCDNPGYVWLQAANVSEAENDINDPEGVVDDSPEEAELAEQIQTAWWYDIDGNNVIDSTIGAVDVMLAVDTSASLEEFGGGVTPLQDAANDLASQLDSAADARIGGVTFADSVDNFTGLAGSPVNFSGLSAGGGTAMPAALEIAAAELDANSRSEAETFIVLLTDGGPNYETGVQHEIGGYTAGSYSGGSNDWNTVEDGELEETASIADTIRDDHRILAVGINDDRPPEGQTLPSTLSTYLRDEIAETAGDYFAAEDPNAVSDIEGAIIDAIAMPEEVFHRGTLAEDLSTLASGDGVALDGELATDFEEWVEADPDDDEDRECFQPGANYFIGFAWWLPPGVGNEIQGDSVSFDLGFYTEQCRHNDGSGESAQS